MGKSKKPVGHIDGKLYPCPNSPNCISTQALDDNHRMAPISLYGSLKESKNRLLKIVKTLKRIKIISEEDNYVHIEVRTAVFKFIDDVEFFFDENAKVIHFRSRARLGYTDMGVNRKRMEMITNLFLNSKYM
jgi:uncharacterized protein (DUF1499 family)